MNISLNSIKTSAEPVRRWVRQSWHSTSIVQRDNPIDVVAVVHGGPSAVALIESAPDLLRALERLHLAAYAAEGLLPAGVARDELIARMADALAAVAAAKKVTP